MRSCEILSKYRQRVISFPEEGHIRANGKRVTESAARADQTTGDLSIIIGASWMAPNQTRGLIEVHFPERGKRERGRWGDSTGLSSPGIKLLLQTLRDGESAGAGADDVGGGDGILSVAKLKYRAKVCTLDNAGARAALRNRQY